MALTKAELETDLAQYRETYARLLADATAVKGTIQYIERKLAQHALSDVKQPSDLDDLRITR